MGAPLRGTGSREPSPKGLGPLGFDPARKEAFKVLSLFAGIGGFDLGLERTGGFRTIAVAETDPYASKVLAKHFPDAPNVGDVTTAEYPDADIICAGFPCQDISFAGAGAGLAGSRSGLWREVVRAIRVVRPRYAILENVAALLNRGMGTVLGDLAQIGHDAEWHCIPAAAVGAPHRRDRIWIVANPERSEGSERPEPDMQRGRTPEAEQAGLGGEPISGELARLLADAQCAADGRRGIQGPGEGAGALVKGSATEPERSGASVADADGAGLEGRQEHREGADQRAAGSSVRSVPGEWIAEPSVGRVAHGIPKRVDRLRCLGNAVVPQIPELIGRAILATDRLAA